MRACVVWRFVLSLEVRTVRAREALYSAGDEAAFVALVAYGRVDLEHTYHHNANVPLRSLAPGEQFGM